MSTLSSLLPSLLLTLLTLHLLHRLLRSPLRHLPGPWHTLLTPLWLWSHAYTGDESTQITRLHRRYGPVVRLAPHDVSIADGAALAPIYSARGGFLKASCYANFDMEGFATVFSAVDRGVRGSRARAVAPLFAVGRVGEGVGVVEGVVGRWMARLEAAKREKGEVDVLGVCRALALDAVSAYLFGRAFGGLEEEQLSASPFVDSFVAVGRFFLLPPWLFRVVERWVGAGPGEGAVQQSTRKVGAFARSLVESARPDDDDDDTYQARLLRAGISKDEVKVQIEDVIFAGTDSTGMNLSTLCWNLAKHPAIYQTLRHEVLTADARPDPPTNPLTLPYLTATLHETLRTSLANPTRLPRLVPPQGFTFHSPQADRTYVLPPSTTVGLQPHTLHSNPDVFRHPHEFDPARWLREGEPSGPEMRRDFVPFGVGSRMCIARNLAMMELGVAARALARSGVLEGASVVGGGAEGRVEILEWFNSRVKGGKMELVWR